MHDLSEATNPPKQRFVDPINQRYQRYPTLPFYDGRHFEDMHAIMSVVPVRDQDKVMMGIVTSLGIEKGKPFAADATANGRCARRRWTPGSTCNSGSTTCQERWLLAGPSLRFAAADRRKQDIHLGLRGSVDLTARAANISGAPTCPRC